MPPTLKSPELHALDELVGRPRNALAQLTSRQGLETGVEGKPGKEGPEGKPGKEGPEGKEGPKGEFNWRGPWKAATAYAKGDAVSSKGSSYVCIKAMTAGEDVEPPEATHWNLIAGGTELEWHPVEELNPRIVPVGGEYSEKVQYAVDPTGQVYFAGVTEIQGGSVGELTQVWKLPAAARPTKVRIVEAVAINTGSHSVIPFYLEVRPSGEVRTGIIGLAEHNVACFYNSNYSKTAP